MTAAERRLPTFIIIGAQKAATSSLWDAVRRHEQVHCPPPKEPRFFSGEFWWRGRDWYESLYANSGGAIAIGEASTTYTWYPLHSQVPERILDLIPDARFIYVLRDPIERMRSAYVHAVSLGVETRPIGEALLWNSGFLYPTMYALQIEQYLRHVDRSRLLLVSTDDFRSRREETLDRVFRFIGVDPQLPLRPGFEGPLNVGAGRRAPRRIARWATETARRSPLGRHVPEVPRYRPRRLLTKPILDQDAVVDPALRARLIDVLGPDLRRLTELANDEISADELSRWQT